MSVHIEEISNDALEVHVEGTLEKSDYEQFVPAAKAIFDREGSANMLVRIDDFAGWSPRGFWEDLKFDARHYNDIDRLAIVGTDTKQKWMATLSKPFTSADVRYFERDDIHKARKWVATA